MDVILSNRQNKVTIDSQIDILIENAVEKTLKYVNRINGEVSILLVDDNFIKDLNKKYRNIDKITDVLSFALLEDVLDEEFNFQDADKNVLGDVVISIDAVLRQAEDYGHSIERELCYLTIHGVLHLLGYDHKQETEKKQMRIVEERILESLKLIR